MTRDELQNHASRLETMSGDPEYSTYTKTRLSGKAEGIRHALKELDESYSVVQPIVLNFSNGFNPPEGETRDSFRWKLLDLVRIFDAVDVMANTLYGAGVGDETTRDIQNDLQAWAEQLGEG